MMLAATSSNNQHQQQSTMPMLVPFLGTKNDDDADRIQTMKTTEIKEESPNEANETDDTTLVNDIDNDDPKSVDENGEIGTGSSHLESGSLNSASVTATSTPSPAGSASSSSAPSNVMPICSSSSASSSTSASASNLFTSTKPNATNLGNDADNSLLAFPAATAPQIQTPPNFHGTSPAESLPMQIDFGNMFNLFEKAANFSAVPDNLSALPTLSQQFSESSPIDQATLLQLSQFFSAQSQHHSLANVPAQVLAHANGTGKRPSSGGASANGDTAHQGNGNDRKRSYPYTFQYCVLCQKNVHSSKLPCHIRQCHVGKPMFQCPACDFTSTYSKNNVKSHMVSLHGLAGDPISYMDQYAGQVEEFMKKCFPNVRGRGRPVHGRGSPPKSPTINNALGTMPHQHPPNPTSSTAQSSAATLPTVNEPRRRSSIATAQNGAGHHHHHQSNGNQNGTVPNANVNNNSSSSNHNNSGRRILTAARLQKTSNANNGNDSKANANVADVTAAAAAAANLRFNEMFATAQLMAAGGKTHTPASVPTTAWQNGNGYQHLVQSTLNPLLFLQQQLNGLAASATIGSPFAVGNNAVGGTNARMPKLELFDGESIGNGVNNNNKSFGAEDQQKQRIDFGEHFFGHFGEEKNFFKDGEVEDGEKPMIVTGFGNGSRQASPPLKVSTASTFEGPAESRYLPQPLHWSVLNTELLKNTVFKTFSNSFELFEKLDLSHFESLLDRSNRLLTETQSQKIAAVRKMINLKTFEILFAVHRLDLDVLKPENVKLVAKIAPTDVDICRFTLFEQSNSISGLNEDEQFILQLSKVDRLKEKLAVMEFMGSFDGKITTLNQQLSDLVSASKVLYNSAEFHTLLHLLLTFGNLIVGDFNGPLQLIQGFHPSRIPQMCTFKFPSGISLIDVLADRVHKCFPELRTFHEQCKVVESVSKVAFSKFTEQLHQFERDQRLVEGQLQSSSPNHAINNFLTHCELECAQLRENINATKRELVAMLEFFGESALADADPFCPEVFFGAIAAFSASLDFTFKSENPI